MEEAARLRKLAAQCRQIAATLSSADTAETLRDIARVRSDRHRHRKTPADQSATCAAARDMTITLAQINVPFAVQQTVLDLRRSEERLAVDGA